MTLPAKAFDTAGFIDLNLAKKAGARAVGSYLGSIITRALAQEAATLDLGLFSFWERWANDPMGGAAQGVADATAAALDADDVGQPLGAPIYLPNDEMVPDWATTEAYFRAAAETLTARGRVAGFYGQTSVWHLVKGYGYRYFCHAPDGTPPPYPEANIVQSVSPGTNVGSVSVDVDSIQTADFGGWNAAGLFTLDPPAPPKPRTAPTMFLLLNPADKCHYLIGAKSTPVYLPQADYSAFLAKGVPEIPCSAALVKALFAS
jgi:hypothetical protein